jgi:hypothetical protein
MAYIKTLWKVRKGNGLNKFTESERSGNTVVLTNTPASVTDPGTPFSAENMNKIEQGIFDAHEGIATEAQERQQGDNKLIKRTEMGVSNGVATLNENGVILATQLPNNGSGLMAVATDGSLKGSGTSTDPLGANEAFLENRLNYTSTLKTIDTSIENLQATINSLPKLLKENVTIRVKPGTITTNITVERFYGPGSLIIDAVDANNAVVAAANVQTHKCGRFIVQNNNLMANLVIRGFTSTTIDNICFYSFRNTGYTLFSYCNAVEGVNTNTALYGFYANECSGITYATECTVSNKYHAVRAAGASVLRVSLFHGMANNIIYYTNTGSRISISNPGDVTGTTIYSRVSGGIIVPSSSILEGHAPLANPIFTGIPKVPSKTAAAANDGTLIATEAQVYEVDNGKAPINAALTDAAASSELPDAKPMPITTLLQTIRDNLKYLFANKANDAEVVKLSGNQTIADAKTFSASPAVPSKSAAATNRPTVIATEAQVYNKIRNQVTSCNVGEMIVYYLSAGQSVTLSGTYYVVSMPNGSFQNRTFSGVNPTISSSVTPNYEGSSNSTNVVQFIIAYRRE